MTHKYVLINKIMNYLVIGELALIGFVGGMYLGSKTDQGPKPPPIVRTQTPVCAGKLSLECLIEKQKEFDEGLYQKIDPVTTEYRGGSVSYYKNLIQAHLLEHNIKVLKLGKGEIFDYDKVLSRFENFAESIWRNVVRKRSRVKKSDEIQRQLFGKKGLLKRKGYVGGQANVAYAIMKGYFNCEAAADIYTMVNHYIFPVEKREIKSLVCKTHRTSVLAAEGKTWRYEHTEYTGFRGRDHRENCLAVPDSYTFIKYLLFSYIYIKNGTGFGFDRFPNWVEGVFKLNIYGETVPNSVLAKNI